MGTIVSTVTGCVGSCLGACAGYCACACCTSLCSWLCCGGKPHEHSNKPGSTTHKYLILFALNVTAAIVLRYQNNGIIHLYTETWNACTSDTCIGYGAVFRITWALFVFYILHAFLLLFSVFSRIDRIHWPWHYLVYIGILVACFAIPSVFYDEAWVNIARFLSALFLFFQIVILIDFAYSWNESWTADDKHVIYKALVLVISIFMYLACIVLWVFYFMWFTVKGTGCARNQFFISWTIIESFIVTVVSLSPLAEGGGGLLPAAIVTLYMTWLCYSGLESDPSTCNSLSSQDTLHLILGLILGAAALIYAAYDVATNNSLFGGADAQPTNEGEGGVETVIPAYNKPSYPSSDVELGKPTPVTTNTTNTATSTTNTNGSNGILISAPTPVPSAPDMPDMPASSTPVPSSASSSLNDEYNARLLARRNLRYHLLMGCGSAYMAMLLTNWGSSQQASNGGSSDTAYDQGVESVFIKFATQWVTFLVFLWSLVAPLILNDREFNRR